jgi:hypothetical protein
MTFRNLKSIPIWKIREILDHPHCQGIDGADYEPVKHELEQILWEHDNNAITQATEAHVRKLHKEWKESIRTSKDAKYRAKGKT